MRLKIAALSFTSLVGLCDSSYSQTIDLAGYKEISESDPALTSWYRSKKLYMSSERGASCSMTEGLPAALWGNRLPYSDFKYHLSFDKSVLLHSASINGIREFYVFSESKQRCEQTVSSGSRVPVTRTEPSKPDGSSNRAKDGVNEAFPSNVNKTWSYKPFAILSTRQNKQMSDVYIANTFMCKTPAQTLQATMDLLQNYDLVGTSKTDGTLTVTSFKGTQQGKSVSVALAVDEQSNPRLVRYILVDGMPALNCQ